MLRGNVVLFLSLAQIGSPMAQEIVLGVRNATVSEGDAVELNCTIEGRSYVQNWLKHPNRVLFANGEDRTSDSRLKLRRREAREGQEWNLLIERAKKSDEGWYECQIVVDDLVKKSVGYLHVDGMDHDDEDEEEPITLAISSPVIARGPLNVTASEGQDVTMSCTVLNLGRHSVGWILKDHSAILTVNEHVITRNPRVKVMRESKAKWTLIIENVRKSDEGEYMCQINKPDALKRSGYLKVVPNWEEDREESESQDEEEESDVKSKPPVSNAIVIHPATLLSVIIFIAHAFSL